MNIVARANSARYSIADDGNVFTEEST